MTTMHWKQAAVGIAVVVIGAVVTLGAAVALGVWVLVPYLLIVWLNEAHAPSTIRRCECELRDRQWNPLSGRCERCGRAFDKPRQVPC